MGTHISDVHSHKHRAGHAHAATKPHGRRALPAPITDPVNTGPLYVQGPVVTPKLRRVAVTALTAGSLMAGLGVAHAAAPKEQRKLEAEAPVEPTIEPTVEAAITAPKVELNLEEVAVDTDAVPVVEPEPVVVPEPEPVVVPAKPAAPAVQVEAAPLPKVTQTPVPAAPVAPVANSDRAQRIVNAALAQIGRAQDCTMLVTNSLAAVGINFHGWPHEYYSLGYAVSAADALPGDLIYYANGGGGMAHIAINLGNGRAVHGGYNGNQTIEWTANVPAPATAAQYIRLR